MSSNNNSRIRLHVHEQDDDDNNQDNQDNHGHPNNNFTGGYVYNHIAPIAPILFYPTFNIPFNNYEYLDNNDNNDNNDEEYLSNDELPSLEDEKQFEEPHEVGGVLSLELINNALRNAQNVDIMDIFFGNMMDDYENRMEEKMMDIAMRESLNQYKTQEKKPGVVLKVESCKATSDHKDDLCPICNSNIVENEEVTILNCKHIHHTECIGEWVKYKSECPVCRGPISTVDTNNPEEAV